MKNRFFYKTAFLTTVLLSLAVLPVFTAFCVTEKSDTFNPETSCSIVLDFSSSQYDLPDKTEVCVYRIADYGLYNGNPQARYTEKYARLSVPISDIDGEDETAKIKKYIVENNISQDFTILTENKKAVISDLQSGIYFIMKQTGDKGKLVFSPFVVCLPAFSAEKGEYMYSVTSNPKIAVYEGERETVETTGEKLPQTGQLWWPAIALAVFGIALIFCAYFIKILL